jgi:hypothetical protein
MWIRSIISALNSINIVARAAWGLILTVFCTRRFPLEILSGKRVVLVGPASTALQTGNGAFIDSFDFVVRLNKAPMQLSDGRFAADIGTRTDILFHSFYENEFSGGGPLDLALYSRLGIKYVIQPVPTLAGWRVIFNFYKKYMEAKRVFTLARRPFGELALSMTPFKPTTGLCAMKCLMESDISELHIIGFTFFRTAYGEGYRDEMKRADQAREYISKMKIHNPDQELREFIKMTKGVRNKKIVMDKALQNIVDNER